MKKRANNEGTIIKRTRTIKGKTYTYWEAKVTTGYDPITGKIIRSTYSGKTQKEVKEKMQEVSVSVSQRTYIHPSKITVEEWAKLWLQEFQTSKKYKTVSTHTSHIRNHIVPVLGKIKLSDLTPTQIQLFYNSLHLSPSSVHSIHGTLSAMLSDAVEMGHIPYNFASKRKLPTISSKHIHPLSDDDIRRFLAALEGEKYADLFKTILFTGIREAEAIGLTWDCINFQNKTMRIYRQLQYRKQSEGGFTFCPTKTNKARTISLTTYLCDLLQERKNNQKPPPSESWQADHPNDILVFPTSKYKPIQPKSIYEHFEKLMASIGLQGVRVHDLRHTFATLSFQNGDDIKTVQQNLGHSTASTTLNIYAHVSETMSQNSASRMQSYIDSIYAKKDPSE